MKIKCRKKKSNEWHFVASISVPHLVCFVSACSSKSWSVLYKGHFGKKRTNKKTNKKPVLILPPLRQKKCHFWLFIFLLLKEFVWLQQVLVAACGILAPWPGIGPRRPALGAWSRSHWTAREVPLLFWIMYIYHH